MKRTFSAMIAMITAPVCMNSVPSSAAGAGSADVENGRRSAGAIRYAAECGYMYGVDGSGFPDIRFELTGRY